MSLPPGAFIVTGGAVWPTAIGFIGMYGVGIIAGGRADGGLGAGAGGAAATVR